MADEVIKVVFRADDAQVQDSLNRLSKRFDDLENRRGRPRDFGLPPSASQGLDAYSRKAEKAAEATRQLGQAGYRAGRGGMSGSFGFLAFSQAVEDAQYGIRGVLNNIPQMVIGFGGGVGLAGAISLAAVAAANLLPRLIELYGANDVDKLKEADEAWREAFDSAMEAANEIERAADAEARGAALAAEWNAVLAERFAVVSQLGGFYKGQLENQRAERDAALELLAIRQRLAASLGGDEKPFIAERQRIETAGIAEDLATVRKDLAYEDQRAVDLAEKRAIAVSEAADTEAAATERLIRLKKDLAGAEGNIAAANNIIDNEESTKEQKKNAVSNRANSTARRDEIQAEIDLEESRRKAAAAASAAAIKAADSEIERNRTRLQTLVDEEKALELLGRQKKELNKLERQQVAAEDVKATQQKLQAEQELLEAKIKESLKREEALAALDDELTILDAKLNLDKKAADEVEREVRLRQEAVKLARDTGLEESKALQIIKEKDAIERAAAKTTPAGSIRERREARSKERAEERQQARNDRVAAARRRQAARNKANNDSKLDPKTEDGVKAQQQIEEARAKERAERDKAGADLFKNSTEQLNTLKRIEAAAKRITAA